MNKRYVDNGYYYTDEYGFYESVNEDNLSNYNKEQIRLFWENYGITE